MAEEKERRRTQIATVVGIGQILAMMLGFGSVIYALGQKGEQLDRARADMHALSDAVADLASAQASAAVADAKDKSSIEDIKRRLDALERVIEALRVR
jgi:hypothetical protein